ncbi:molybdopterin synthase sulfur carrier subunit [Catenovulum agarivorans]|uniref:molybdopterin synthase sulfur carrier subunit n=1 Tax=Catenovulum agarivorans TaxID=1172192 RepID=UPI00031330E4|nr:molybdopterin synthase sulfur carrier subunit [Catenovulum agarivorans]
MIKVLFFAQLRETLGQEEYLLDAESLNVAELKKLLIEQNPAWQTALQEKRLLVAVNQNMANEHSPINSGDEVAFFPPVTGG